MHCAHCNDGDCQTCPSSSHINLEVERAVLLDELFKLCPEIQSEDREKVIRKCNLHNVNPEILIAMVKAAPLTKTPAA